MHITLCHCIEWPVHPLTEDFNSLTHSIRDKSFQGRWNVTLPTGTLHKHPVATAVIVVFEDSYGSGPANG